MYFCNSLNWEQLPSSLLWSYYLPNIFFKTLCRKSNNITRDLKNRFAFLRRPVSKCRSLTSLSSKLSKEIESIFGDRCSEWDTSSKKKEQRREVISTFFYFITLPIVVVTAVCLNCYRHAQSCENFLLETTRVYSRVESIYPPPHTENHHNTRVNLKVYINYKSPGKLKAMKGMYHPQNFMLKYLRRFNDVVKF